MAVGSGQAIELGRRGEADVVLAHSPDAERELMKSGVAGAREIVMAFASWILSRPAQRIIASFGREEYGEALFTPDAGRSEDDIAAGA